MGDVLKNDLLRWVLQYVPESDRDAVFGVCKMWRKHYRFVNPSLAYVKASQCGNKRFAALVFACCETALLCHSGSDDNNGEQQVERALFYAIDNGRLDHACAIADCAPRLPRAAIRSCIVPLLVRNESDLAIQLLRLVKVPDANEIANNLMQMGIAKNFFDQFVSRETGLFYCGRGRIESLSDIFLGMIGRDPTIVYDTLLDAVTEYVGPHVSNPFALCLQLLSDPRDDDGVTEFNSILRLLTTKPLLRWLCVSNVNLNDTTVADVGHATNAGNANAATPFVQHDAHWMHVQQILTPSDNPMAQIQALMQMANALFAVSDSAAADSINRLAAHVFNNLHPNLRDRDSILADLQQAILDDDGFMQSVADVASRMNW